MLPLIPQSRSVLATQPVDLRKAMDGRAALCHQGRGDTPLAGTVYVFRHRPGTALHLWLYEGPGYWLMMKRLSQGRLAWWPTSADARVPLSARELLMLLGPGAPERAQMARAWRRVAYGGTRRA